MRNTRVVSPQLLATENHGRQIHQTSTMHLHGMHSFAPSSLTETVWEQAGDTTRNNGAEQKQSRVLTQVALCSDRHICQHQRCENKKAGGITNNAHTPTTP